MYDIHAVRREQTLERSVRPDLWATLLKSCEPGFVWVRYGYDARLFALSFYRPGVMKAHGTRPNDGNAQFFRL
jgi:hypothetical protein